jgi:hypothetical protein
MEALEQHQPDWNSPADKVSRENNELEMLTVSSQTKNALVDVAERGHGLL